MDSTVDELKRLMEGGYCYIYINEDGTAYADTKYPQYDTKKRVFHSFSHDKQRLEQKHESNVINGVGQTDILLPIEAVRVFVEQYFRKKCGGIDARN